MALNYNDGEHQRPWIPLEGGPFSEESCRSARIWVERSTPISMQDISVYFLCVWAIHIRCTLFMVITLWTHRNVTLPAELPELCARPVLSIGLPITWRPQLFAFPEELAWCSGPSITFMCNCLGDA